MIIAEDIRKKVEQTEPGVVLTPADFGVAKKLQPALIVALNRMVATGVSAGIAGVGISGDTEWGGNRSEYAEDIGEC